jgi:hypothetical protein
VVNPGSRERCREILGFLASRGVNAIERMLFTANRKPRLGGASALLDGITVRHIIFPAGFKRSRFAKFAMDKARSKGTFVTIMPSSGVVDAGAVWYHSPGFFFSSVQNGGFEVRWKSISSSAFASLRPVSPGEFFVDVGFLGLTKFEREMRVLISNKISCEVVSGE